jgi:hypothetical protein
MRSFFFGCVFSLFVPLFCFPRLLRFGGPAAGGRGGSGGAADHRACFFFFVEQMRPLCAPGGPTGLNFFFSVFGFVFAKEENLTRWAGEGHAHWPKFIYVFWWTNC